MTDPTYTEPTWTDVPAGTTPPSGALPLSAAELTSAITHPIKQAIDRANASLRIDAAQALPAGNQAFGRGNLGLGDIATHPASDFVAQPASGDPVGAIPVKQSGGAVAYMADGIRVPPPTGVAATDTANVQAAITAAKATGQYKQWKLRFTVPGTYQINQPIDFGSLNVEGCAFANIINGNVTPFGSTLWQSQLGVNLGTVVLASSVTTGRVVHKGRCNGLRQPERTLWR